MTDSTKRAEGNGAGGLLDGKRIRCLGGVLLFLLLPFVVFYWQIPFLGSLTIGNDYPAWGIGQQMMLQFSLRHGTFPLFVPGFADGQTAAALTLGQMYHPFPHIAARLPGYWNGGALEWGTLLRLLSLGLLHALLFRLLRRLQLSVPLAFTLAFITVYNMAMLDSFRYGASLENYTGSLLLCTAMAFYYLRPISPGVPQAIVGATFWLTCGGHPQKMFYGFLTALIAFFLIPAMLPVGEDESRTRRKYFVTVPLLVLLGLLLSCAYLLPFGTEFMADNSIRVGQSYGWSLVPRDSIAGLLGSFVRPLGGDVHGAFGSTSLIALVCLVPLVIFSRRQRRGPLLVTWLIAALVLLCSFGDKTPVYGLFWKYVPFTSSFRGPVRITVILPFLFLLMLAQLLRRESAADRFPVRLLAAALPVYWISHQLIRWSPADPGAMTPQRIHALPPWVEPALLWLGVGTLVLAMIHLMARFNRRGAVAFLLSAGLIFSVVAQGVIEMRFGTWVTPRRNMSTLREMNRRMERKLTFGLGSDYSLQSSLVTGQKSRSTIDPFLARFWRRCALVGNQETAYAYLAREDVTHTLCVEGVASPCAGNMATANGNPDRVELRHATFNALDFGLHAGASGYMSLAFPFSRNWRAFVDRSPVPLFRANGYLLAIPLTAGDHLVRFEYHSPASTVGMAVSCLTLLLLGVWTVLGAGFRSRWWRAILVTAALLVPTGTYLYWQHSLYQGDNLHSVYAWNSNQFPPSGNLAYGKACLASSMERLEDYPGLAVDGFDRTSFRTQPGSGEWWQVDLGREIPLQKLVIQRKRAAGFSAARLSILLSVDGRTFQPAAELSDPCDTAPLAVTLPGQFARYIRLQTEEAAPVAIRELEAYAAQIAAPGAG